jgi:hypothetical protein
MLYSLKICFVWAAKFGSPILLIAMTLFMTFGSLSIDPKFTDILSRYEYDFAIQTGFGRRGNNNYNFVSRSYLLLSSAPFSSTTVRITNYSDGTQEIEKIDGGLLNLVTGYLILILAIWWFWIREKTHNKALQTDAAKPRR